MGNLLGYSLSLPHNLKHLIISKNHIIELYCDNRDLFGIYIYICVWTWIKGEYLGGQRFSLCFNITATIQ